MKPLHKRFLGFLLLCIPLRLLFVYIIKNTAKLYLPYLGILSLLPAIGFTIIYFGNYRKTGMETFGKKIWWNNLRPVHALLYFLFAYLAINKSDISYIPLFVDVMIGLISFIIYHYHVGSFALL